MEGRTQELLSLKKLEEKDPFDCGTSTGFSLTSVGLKQYIYIHTHMINKYIYIYIYNIYMIYIYMHIYICIYI